jgi:hypothetical protein
LHPDGFFTIGAIPSKKVRQEDKCFERQWDSQFELHTWLGYNNDTEAWEVDRKEWLMKDTVEWQKKHLQGQNVGLSNVHNSDNEVVLNSEVSQGNKKQYGLKGITSTGKRRVIDGCTILEDTYGIKRLGFGTLTIPNLSPEAMILVNKLWSKLIETFHRYLRRFYELADITPYVLGVTEVQTGRLQKYAQFALHYHFVYVACDVKGKFYFTADWVRKKWQKILSKVLRKHGIDEEVSTAAAVDLQKVKKSAKHYLSKYVSKGKQEAEALAEAGYGDQIPSQWWAMTKAMRDRIKGALVKISQDMCYFILENRETLIDLEILKKFAASASFTKNDEEVICGYWGIASNQGIIQLFDVF